MNTIKKASKLTAAHTNSFDLDQETDYRSDRVRCTARMQTHKLSMCRPVQQI
ncbi:hypothetical protein QTP88_014160 [Uroleucon formosanum]